MSILTPGQAAQIASGVYGLRMRTISQSLERGATLGCEGLFVTSDDSRLVGRSGGLIGIKQLSGFGYIAQGTGERAGEVLVATRGTATMYDWLSNFNIGLRKGPGGLPVHAGFHEVWKSFAPEITEFMRRRNPSTIHCVGHSLGGALATINADYFSTLGAADVRLYTFGSPRAGDVFFSRSLSDRLGAANIYRVHHDADPVPKIPLFPFIHVPYTTSGYQITAGPSGLINIDAHSMAKSYIPGVGEGGWAALARAGASAERDDPKAWLDQVGAHGSGILVGSAWGLMMIGKALTWLLEKIGQLVIGALGLTLASSMTVLDRLAWLLSKGAELSVEVSVYVANIISAIFRFLGRTAMGGVSLTLGFIRWVLGLLFNTVATVTRRALAASH